MYRIINKNDMTTVGPVAMQYICPWGFVMPSGNNRITVEIAYKSEIELVSRIFISFKQIINVRYTYKFNKFHNKDIISYKFTPFFIHWDRIWKRKKGFFGIVSLGEYGILDLLDNYLFLTELKVPKIITGFEHNINIT